MTSPSLPTRTRRSKPELLVSRAVPPRTAEQLEGVFSVQVVERCVFESCTALDRTGKRYLDRALFREPADPALSSPELTALTGTPAL